MTHHPRHPRPLLERSDTPELLRSVLKAGVECEPTDQQLARLDARMSALVGLPLAASVAASTQLASATIAGAKPWAGAILGLKVGGAVMGATLLTGVGWMTVVEPKMNRDVPVQTVAQPVARGRVLPPVLRSAPTVEAISIAEPPASAPSRSPSEVGRTAPAGSASLVESPAASAQQEVALLEQAQRALRQGRAQDALRLVQEHQGLPQAVLGQERERIAIEALVQMGDVDTARQRAEQFALRYGQSSYLPRIRQLVGVPRSTGETRP